MITAIFKEHRHNKTISIKIKGHAQTAPEGEDLVCAASSAYGFQAIQTVKSMFEAGWLVRKPKMRIDKGDIHISLRPKNEYYTVVINMLQVVATGYQLLENSYPDNVQLTAFAKPEEV
jgi:uncharacterized protein YsxB (DUF464 family)